MAAPLIASTCVPWRTRLNPPSAVTLCAVPSGAMTEKQKRWGKRFGVSLLIAAGTGGLAVVLTRTHSRTGSGMNSATLLPEVRALTDAVGQIVCNDGWPSPTPCSKQGVCSGHGGIAA